MDWNFLILPTNEAPVFMYGSSPAMRAIETAIKELAEAEVPVLVWGEHGVGKRAAAREIHRISRPTASPFADLQSASLKAHVFAHSGRMTDLLAEPDQGYGTLFLSEIGELRPECQAKLLKALSDSEAGGPGSWHTRLVCGTSRDLEADVRSERFREDLYYRISGVCLHIPPLRQRQEDILVLLDFFLARQAAELGRTKPALSLETEQLLQAYSWPGNVRELEAASLAIVRWGGGTKAGDRLQPWLSNSSLPKDGQISLKQAAKDASRHAERELILKVLTRTRWNRKRAAQELQISYKALLYKLKQIGLEEYGTS